RDPRFLPEYRQVESAGEVIFASGLDEPRPSLYLVKTPAPPWDWPDGLVVVDTPDFDSVREENQAQALDMARRADAVILVAHQAKYADQSTWDFLTAEAGRGRPFLIILNRVTAAAAVDDFRQRLERAGVKAPVLPWPEETAVGQVNVVAARRELCAWLEDLGRRGREVVAGGGRRAAGDLARLMRSEVFEPLEARLAELERGLAGARAAAKDWAARPMDRASLTLPGETRADLLKNLGEMVRRSDLWAKPRRIIGQPLALIGEGFRKIFGRNSGEAGAERRLADNLIENAREALVAAVRAEARELASAAAFASSPAGLDLTPDEIRARHTAMAARLDEWLKKETAELLSGLPIGQKAAFYLVQFMHAGLVAGLWLQTGGLPGTEVLVGGALGPVVSQLTGAVISRESLNAFEAKAAEAHQRELAAIFQEQGRRYEDRLEAERNLLLTGRNLAPALAALEKEATRLWG
ncbi:MAG: hypothetical protein LBV79_07350, partial [Candidatus Adiutrix sp.]|nr:hypothetical protein [Candidatus Adiutrix sp.]